MLLAYHTLRREYVKSRNALAAKRKRTTGRAFPQPRGKKIRVLHAHLEQLYCSGALFYLVWRRVAVSKNLLKTDRLRPPENRGVVPPLCRDDEL